MTLTCIHCNAPLKGAVCKTCSPKVKLDKIVLTHINFEKEKVELSKLKKELKKAADGEIEALLLDGFMPETPEGLILAGLDMVPLLKVSDEFSTLEMEAVQERLTEIVDLLTLSTPTDQVEMAITEFREVRSLDQRANHYMEIMLGIGILILFSIPILIDLFG